VGFPRAPPPTFLWGSLEQAATSGHRQLLSTESEVHGPCIPESSLFPGNRVSTSQQAVLSVGLGFLGVR
jgi:hypothetical protein